MRYATHDFQRACLYPAWMALRDATEVLERLPLKHKSFALATLKFWERLTKEFPEPAFNLAPLEIPGHGLVAIEERVLLEKPFCRLRHFAKKGFDAPQPRLLLVSPLSGHFPTLLRGTVESLLPHFDVVVTHWRNARDVPLTEGPFSLQTYTDYLVEFIQHFEGQVHVAGICQPVVPLLMAAAHLAAQKSPVQPQSLILFGGPVDARINPTLINKAVLEKSLSWFEANAVLRVPAYYEGAGRRVCPGFFLVGAFASMNGDRHLNAYLDLYTYLLDGAEASVALHNRFYDEYFAAMDIPAEYYLETIHAVFHAFLLPRGRMTYQGERVDLGLIQKPGLMVIEGGRDDISGPGQSKAALTLCQGIPENRKAYHLQGGVGHYGVFSGRRFRAHVVPQMVRFVAGLGAV